MGAVRVTTQNLQVMKTDVERGLIMIKGAVPGSKGGWVTIKDSVKKPLVDNVPFPAALRSEGSKIDEAPQPEELHDIEVKGEEAITPDSENSQISLDL